MVAAMAPPAWSLRFRTIDIEDGTSGRLFSSDDTEVDDHGAWPVRIRTAIISGCWL
jgi:hypothetical protein